MIHKFTVVTITYNSSNYVEKTIESVLNQSFSDFEYIISDDFSEDKTWQLIQNYKDPRIRALRNEKNIGEYANRNKTLKIARGEFIIYVDGDDILFRDTLRNLSEYIEFFPDAGMIWGVPFAYFNFVVLPYLFDPKIVVQLIYQTNIPLANIGFSETVFKTEKLKEFGGFSNEYSIGDVYIKKKLALAVKTLFIPMGLMFWRTSENQASRIASSTYKGFIDGYKIDTDVLTDNKFPLDNKVQLELIKASKASLLRRIIIKSLFKFKFKLFLKFWIIFDLSIKDFSVIFKKYNNKNFLDKMDIPLLNEYHFKKR